MHLRFAALAVALLAAGCASKSRTQEPTTAAAPRPTPVDRENKTVASIGSGAELRVRLNQDFGPAASPARDNFTARVVSALVAPNGRVIVPVGSLVWGHVVNVDEGNRRVEIAFDRIETRTAVYRLSATVVSAQPWAMTVKPEGAATSTTTAVLEGATPSAIGGGPLAPESEPAEDDAPRGDVIVPFDAELGLKLTAPLFATSAL